MKNLAAGLLTHLQTGGPFVMADLYTITLVSGTVLRWADFDRDLTHPNTYTYSATGPALKRGNTRIVIGLEVDTLDLSVYPRASDTVAGVGLLAAALGGAFDSARFVLDRAFVDSSGAVIGIVNMFTGRFSDITISRTEMQVRVNSDLEALSVNLPRNIYQAGCLHTLYDAGCGLTETSWQVGGSVSTGVTTSVIPCNLTAASGWYNRGTLRFINGDLAGVARTIKSYVPGQATLFLPLPAVPDVGDLFVAAPGCNKTQATCSAKFSNSASFRGCPFIPVPETAI